ncbi:MAG: plasmid pRiA4b ORF-3 family protein [Saprospiraceae bacterium]
MPLTVYQLRIDLEDASLPIWRRVVVPADISLADLSDVIQMAMDGWDGSHLHQFSRKGKIYAPPSEYEDPETSYEGRRLNQLLKKDGDEMVYEYDFGDGWRHAVKLEEIRDADADKTYPLCVAGENACPPEDIGGVWGYQVFLEARANKKHPQHEEMMEWLDGEAWDPHAFDLEGVSQYLQEAEWEWRE